MRAPRARLARNTSMRPLDQVAMAVDSDRMGRRRTASSATLPRATLRWVEGVLAQRTTCSTWAQQLSALRFLCRIGSAEDVRVAKAELAILQETHDDTEARLKKRQSELAKLHAEIVEWRQHMSAESATEALRREEAAARAAALEAREEEISRALQHERKMALHRKRAERGRIAAEVHVHTPTSVYSFSALISLVLELRTV